MGYCSPRDSRLRRHVFSRWRWSAADRVDGYETDLRPTAGSGAARPVLGRLRLAIHYEPIAVGLVACDRTSIAFILSAASVCRSGKTWL